MATYPSARAGLRWLPLDLSSQTRLSQVTPRRRLSPGLPRMLSGALSPENLAKAAPQPPVMTRLRSLLRVRDTTWRATQRFAFEIATRIASFMEVRTMPEKQTAHPPKLLGGWWSGKGTIKAPRPTGNFLFVLSKDTMDAQIAAAHSILCRPFPGSTLIPCTGWTYAQIRGVPTVFDDSGVIPDGDKLTEELRRNEVLKSVVFCNKPHWYNNPLTLTHDTSAILISYKDVTSAASERMKQEGLWMFGCQVKVVITGDTPTLDSALAVTTWAFGQVRWPASFPRMVFIAIAVAAPITAVHTTIGARAPTRW